MIEAGSRSIASARLTEAVRLRVRDDRRGARQGGAHAGSPPAMPAVAGRVPHDAVRQVAIA